LDPAFLWMAPFDILFMTYEDATPVCLTLTLETQETCWESEVEKFCRIW